MCHVFEYDELKGYRFLQLKIVYNYPGQDEEDGIDKLIQAASFLIDHLKISVQVPQFFPCFSEEWTEFPTLYTCELSEGSQQVRICTLKKYDHDQFIPFDAPFCKLTVLNPDQSLFAQINMPNKFNEIRKTHKNTTIKFEENRIALYDENGNFLQVMD